jgi:ribosomal protein RSM22 (predicted rRNA methylase)
MLVDMPKAYVVAAEADTLDRLPRTSPLKILDLGVGYGAQSLGLLSYLFQRDWESRIRLDIIDKDAEALDTVVQFLNNCQHVDLLGEVIVNDWRIDLNQDFHTKDRYDMIIVGSTLCELQPATQYPLLVKLLSALTEYGVLFVLEPALKAITRNLHQLRDRLLAEQRCHILAPCTRQGNCPCLEHEKDWCHESRQILLPPRARQLAATTGLRMHNLKWSYMTLARPWPNHEKHADAWRVVGDLLKPKGKHEIFVCGKAGRLRAILQKRDKSPRNKYFKKLRRGQLAWLEGTTIKDDMMMLSRESLVESKDPIKDILS